MPRAAAWSRPGPMLHRLLLTNGSNFTNFLKAEKRQCPCSIQQRAWATLQPIMAVMSTCTGTHTVPFPSKREYVDVGKDSGIWSQALLSSRAGELSPDQRWLGDEGQGGCCHENCMAIILEGGGFLCVSSGYLSVCGLYFGRELGTEWCVHFRSTSQCRHRW